MMTNSQSQKMLQEPNQLQTVGTSPPPASRSTQTVGRRQREKQAKFQGPEVQVGS